MSTTLQQDAVLRGNILILTVDELLSGWPTYIIDFTPGNPGPMKLLLCLKGGPKYIFKEDSDDDEDHPKTIDPSILENRRKATIMVDVSSAIEQDEAYRKIPKHCAKAAPVELYGIRKGPKVPKRPIFLDDSGSVPWPPIRPRAFRHVSSDVATTSLHLISTIPAPVKATPTNNSDKGEKGETDNTA
ncbi:hypothetical protein BDN67DRAFT_1011082 [Paxillus ammoniavirescens]|nr:hypothetical protein BDN67DRAFT_1011082 [Paxillus ammoniavirescens]